MSTSLNRGATPVAVTTVIIGGGHSGLAMSRYLTALAIDHVVLERGEVANSWRTERWDSLRLLTPNWLCRLPGYAYSGDDPDGFMTMPEVIAFIANYASETAAPVHTETRVSCVTQREGGYVVSTDKGVWHCRAVVLANGNFSSPKVPVLASQLPATINQLTPRNYRNPGQLPEGGVLVVGASATGLQLANEIHRSGRPVTLAAGEHVRMPRTYRGRDIQYWMQRTGILDQDYRDVDDLVRARRVPSPQLVGAADRSMLDLNRLTASGVQVVGRLAGIGDSALQFSGSLANICKLADLKMERLLATIDRWIDESGMTQQVGEKETFAPTLTADAPLTLDLKKRNIRTVIWATGYRPDYSFLQVPVFDRQGQLRHDGGVVDAPGLYVMGGTFMRRRKSSFIHGAEDDAADLSIHLSDYLGGLRQRATG